jgi:hypothetical protein
MACVQFLQLEEETTRGTSVGTTLLSLPVMNTLLPSFNPEDEGRDEFAGECTGLGSRNTVRRGSQWTYSLECAYYPIAATGLLLKHSLGKSGTRSVVDTTAYSGISYPVVQPYGTGRELEDKAIGIWVVYEKEGVSYKRYYGGGRITSATLTGEGTDDAKLTFEIQGPGEYIGSEAVNDLTFTNPTVSPFVSSDILMYIGSGISRTGTAPDFTALDVGTMDAFKPDSLTVTWTSGLNDKVIIDGIQGPNKTTREGKFAVEAQFPIDLADPASGFSSWDEYTARLSGPHTNSVLITMDNGEVAGSTTETYSTRIDLANLLAQHETPEVNSDGSQGTVALSYASLYDTTAEYPIGILTVDQVDGY